MASENKVFIPHVTECWAPAIATGGLTPGTPLSFTLIDPCDSATTDALKTVTYDNGSWTKLKAVPGHEGLPPFASAVSVLFPVVDPLEGKDNIADLQFVSEGAVLQAIRVRYKKKIIYTNVGRIVVALNPFERRDDLYNDAVVSRYSKSDTPYSLPPHVFQISAAAFKGIAEDSINQSTLITGESGAGKTESTKLLLRYFAALGGGAGTQNSLSAGKVSIEDRIMMANPILEALGNASTSRNPNSSRFGKWIEILFDERNRIKGASITSYMLEMPRVCEHLYCDRAYHIFYQVVANKLGGTSGNPGQFKYLTPSPPPAGSAGKTGLQKKVNDAEMYSELLQALKDYDFTANEQNGIFNLIACILFLGNIEFEATSIKGAEGSGISSKSSAEVSKAAELMGTDITVLTQCLLAKKITTGRETMDVPLKPENASAARDGLAKLIYGSLFNWILSRINLGLSVAGGNYKSIGVLDIAGFERFEVNSFEQLLINLSNEKLQQHFNKDIIMAELEDYKKEGLVDLQLDFTDNSSILALIESKGGIIDVLDEELFVPKGSDAGFVSKLTKAHSKAPNYVPPKFAGEPTFGVSHFAGAVVYTASGWLDKNRLNPPREAFETLAAANNNVVKQMVKLIVVDTKKVTVGGSFRKQLTELMTKIQATQTHYVRCVKPNSSHTPGDIESCEMLRQLKCAGIMEAIKIRKSGYSLRITYEDFCDRYALLVGTKKPKNKTTAEEIIAVAKSKGSVGAKDVFFAQTKLMAKESVRELLDHMRIETVEDLKRPLMVFIEGYDTAVKRQGGMFLYPSQILGPDVDTPLALEKQLRLLTAGLEEVEKKLGTLENPPGWVGTALLVQKSMKREIEVVTALNGALCQVKPVACDAAVVSALEKAKASAESSEVTNGAYDKIKGILDLIAEEKDWEVQLLAEDTDCASLIEEIIGSKRELLTPSCHKALAAVQAREAMKKKGSSKVIAVSPSTSITQASLRQVSSAHVEDPALLKSDSLTLADAILSQARAKMPPPKTNGENTPEGGAPALGKKAQIARSIAKRNPVVKVDLLKLAPRPKLSQRRLADPQPG